MSNDDYEKRLTGFIIHGFAVAHSIAAALLAQTLVGDEAALTVLTVAMIICIARINKRSWHIGDALSMVGVLAGWYLGTRGAVFLVKWIPGLGNGINAVVTFGVTELIGWTTYILVKEGKKPQELTDSEKETIRRRAEELRDENAEESKRLYDSMSDEDKEEYQEIMKQLRKKNLPDGTMNYLTKRIESIARKYVVEGENENTENFYEIMSDEDREEYDEITKQLQKENLPEDTSTYLSKRLESIKRKYI